MLFDEIGIDFIIHGDDPCISSTGVDCYKLAKERGKYIEVKRTEVNIIIKIGNFNNRFNGSNIRSKFSEL